MKELQSCSAPSSGFQVASFHHDWGLLVSKATMELEREEWEQCKIKCYTKFTVFAEIQPFFLNKCSDCCKPVVNFQSPERVDSIFASILTAFMKENFQRFLLCHYC